MRFKLSWNLLFVFLFCAYFLLLCFFYNFEMNDYQQFAVLAKSFLAGKLYFIQEYSSWWHDAVAFNGQHYWPLGPLPAIILIPFQIFISQGIFHQGSLQPFLVLGVFLTVYSIAQKLDYKKEDSLYLAAAFCFASVFLGVAFWPNSWFFSQVITVLLMLLALREWLGKRRFWVIGVIWGLVLLTRVTAATGIIFFIAEALGRSGRLGRLAKLGIPIAVAAIFLGWYNFARFGNPFELGYSMQLAAGNFSGSLQYGLFSVKHILENLYYMLLSFPLPVIEGEWSHNLVAPFIKADPWGLSIFITSPYLLMLFLFSYKNKILKLLLGISILIAIPIIFYYGIGWYQFGYRYALDFFPFLFLLFMIGYKVKSDTLSWKMKALVVLSSFVNLYLFSNLFIL